MFPSAYRQADSPLLTLLIIIGTLLHFSLVVQAREVNLLSLGDSANACTASGTDSVWPWNPSSTSPISNESPFPNARSLFASTATAQSLYIIGGKTGDSNDSSTNGTYYNDVFRWDVKSLNWTLLPTPSFSRRIDASLFPCNNQSTSINGDCLILLGGMGPGINGSNTPILDVWQSPDSGYSWTLVTNQYPFTYRIHRAISYNPISGSTLVSGGVAGQGQLSADIDRYEKDGTWTHITSMAPFGKRFKHAIVWLNDGSTYGTHILLAGLTPNNAGISTEANDVWSSADIGVTWNLVTPNAPFTARFDIAATLAIGKDGILIVGGSSLIGQPGRASPTRSLGDGWLSNNNGKSWQLLSNAAINPPRSMAGSAFFLQSQSNNIIKGQLIIAGGSYSNLTTSGIPLNDQLYGNVCIYNSDTTNDHTDNTIVIWIALVCTLGGVLFIVLVLVVLRRRRASASYGKEIHDLESSAAYGSMDEKDKDTPALNLNPSKKNLQERLL